MLSYTKTRFHEIRIRLENHIATSRLNGFLWEFFLFGFKQGWACLFGAILLSLVLLTKWLWPQHAWIARYDFLLLSALAVQALLLVLRMESIREAFANTSELAVRKRLKQFAEFKRIGPGADVSGF